MPPTMTFRQRLITGLTVSAFALMAMAQKLASKERTLRP